MKETTPLERIQRFDDVFKLTLTLLVLSITFGLKVFDFVFNLETGFWYFLCLAIWSIGHLFGGQLEPSLKLVSWYLLIGFMPFIFPPFTYALLVLPVYSEIVLLFVCLMIYWSVWKYLLVSLRRTYIKIILFTIPTMISGYIMLGTFLVHNLNLV